MTTRIISGALLSALLTIAACKSGADKKTAEAAGTVAAPVQNDTVHQPAADSSHTAGLPHFKMMDEQGRAVALDSLKGKRYL